MTNARQIVSLQVGQPQPLLIEGRTVMSAIGKQPVGSLANPQRVSVGKMGLQGDDQVDTSVHGGLAKAIYAYPLAHYAFWQTVRAQAGVSAWDAPLPFGLPGENLTLSGVVEADVWVGDVLQFPDCALAVSEPRKPCFKFAHVMGFAQAVKLMAQSGYCGFYLSVRTPGTLAAGDTFELVPGPRDVNIRELFTAKMKSKAYRD